MPNQSDTLWKLLWDYDPNGLVVVDTGMRIQLVNPAFCEMFRRSETELLSMHISRLFGDISNFETAWKDNRVLKSPGTEYPQHNLYIRKVIFPIKGEGLVACIVVDLTYEWQQRNELSRIQRETLEHVDAVVNKQMHVAQQIAGLLGESTAETKVSFLKLQTMLEQEVSPV